MLNTYQAELHKDKINWIDPIPKEISKDYIYKVKIQFLEREVKKQFKNDLVEFFQNSPLKGIELDLERPNDTSREIEL